jgi:hypothetical protein
MKHLKNILRYKIVVIIISRNVPSQPSLGLHPEPLGCLFWMGELPFIVSDCDWNASAIARSPHHRSVIDQSPPKVMDSTALGSH